MPFNPYMFQPRGFDPTQDYGISNPVPSMRAKNIFSQPTTPEQNTKRFLSQNNPAPQADFSQPESNPQDDAMSYYQAMRERQKPGPALSAYQSALKDQPTYENTPVSTGRKIMGTLAGIAGGLGGGPQQGIHSANEIIETPYKRATSDYTAKMRNLGESAKMEQDQQEADLKAMEAAQKMGLDYKKFGFEREKENFERGIKTGNLEVARGNLESNSSYRNRMAGSTEERAKIEAGKAKDSARNIDSEISNRRGMLGVAQENATTAGRRATTADAAQKATAKFQDATTEWRKSNGKKVSPAQQNYAMDVAFRKFGMDPRYKEFVRPNEKSGFWEVVPEKMDDSELANEFRKKARATIQAEVDKGSIYDDEEEGDPSGGSSGNLTWKPKGR